MENQMSFTNTGGNKSVPDYRDEIYASLTGMVAASLAVTANQLPVQLQTNFQKLGIQMQNQTPSCVSHSVVYLMKLWWFLKTGEIVDFNPQFLHILSAFPGATPEDGRQPRTVLQVAKNIGCCTSKTMPINTSVTNAQYCDPSQITQAMRDEAAQYKIPGFLSVDLTQGAIRKAIATYGAVSMLFSVGSEFWTSKTGATSWAQADIDPLRTPATIVSGHQLTGSGWNTNLEHLVNEWSPAWAQNGESDYIWSEWQNFIHEAWVIAEVPSQVLATVQGLPAQHEFVHNFTQPLKRGDQGPEVRALQIALSIDGEATFTEINGIFGPLTQQAVKLFQVKYQNDILVPAGLSQPTGIVGPNTLSKLNSLFNS